MDRINSAAALRRLHKNVSTTATVLAAADPSAAPLVACPGAKYTIFVQRIVVVTTTDNVATLTFRDDAGTPVVIAATKASPGVGTVTLLDVDEGVPLTEGKDLDLAASGACLAGTVVVEAYAKLTATATASDI